jgi:hypothetical protein
MLLNLKSISLDLTQSLNKFKNLFKDINLEKVIFALII